MDYIDIHELYHYGIPGMKWGHHKAPEVTVSNGNRRGTSQQTEQNNKKEKKPFLYKTAVKTSKRLEKFSKRIPGIGKKVYTKELSDDEHAKRGYAFLATVVATGVTIGAVSKAKSNKSLGAPTPVSSVKPTIKPTVKPSAKSSAKKTVTSELKDLATKKGLPKSVLN